MPTVKEIIEWLSKAYGQDEHVAVDLWAAKVSSRLRKPC